MHAESAVDRMYKRLGINNELQTGDRRFDDRVYVMCDHPHVHTILRESQRLRNAVLAAFDAGFRWIRFDGVAVRMYRDATTAPSKRDLAVLKAVWAAASAFEQTLPSRLADPFLWKALVIEGAIWGLAGYAIGAVIELSSTVDDLVKWTHVWPRDVVAAGCVVAIVTFVVLVAVIALWMRGSSRGHRVIVESVVVLALVLPFAAIQLVSDSNRALDDSPSLFVQDTVRRCEVRPHRGRGKNISHTYHLRLDRPRSAKPRLPAEIEVSKPLCAADGERIDLEIGPGRWGMPWYREIRIGAISWRGSP